MAVLSPDSDRFASAILDAIKSEVTKIADEEAEAAAKRVQDRTRARINEIAVSLLSHFSVERLGHDLRIMVKHSGETA